VYYGIICVLLLAAPVEAQQRENAAQQESPKAEAGISPPAPSPASENANVKQPERPVQQAEAAKNEADRGWKSVTRAEGMQIGINALLFVVVLCQTLIYIQQRNIMRQQIEHAKITERAYLGLRTAITEGYDLGVIPVVRVTLINGGRTPAYEVKAGGILSIGDRFPEHPEITEKESQTFLPSGGHINFNFPFHAPLTAKLVSIISSGEWKVFLHMAAHFVDVWGNKQIVIFKLEFNPQGERWGSYKGPDEEKPIVTIGEPHRK
jgi:hypothetical protein